MAKKKHSHYSGIGGQVDFNRGAAISKGGRPILLLVTDQPEQLANAQRAAELGLVHEVVSWQGDAPAFARALQTAAQRLLAAGEGAAGDGPVRARRRLEAWVDCLLELAEAPS